MNKILVMAHGLGSRWQYNERTNWNPPVPYKQLVPIGDVPNIERTLKLLSWFSQKDILVIAPGEFYPFVSDYAVLASLHEQSGHLHQGIVETYQYWRSADRLVFIYGDVVFEKKVIERILFDDVDKVSFFGRKGSNPYTGKKAFEIFSLVVPHDLLDMFHMRITYGWKARNPRIWGHTYTEKTSNFIELDTWSDDVDSPEEYKAFYPTLLKYALEDDK